MGCVEGERATFRRGVYFTNTNSLPTTPNTHQSHPDIVILATSILSTASVLAALPVARLKRSTLVVDVLSVKEFPKRALLARLPPSFDILCTHPMFGPDSGAGSWDGLAFVYDKVRVGKSSSRTRRADALLSFFRNQGCRMVEMACEEHDRLAAGTQFLTHTVGRVLGGMGVEETAIDTRGYQSLLSLVANTANDSFDLYYGLFMYNPVSFFEVGRKGCWVGKQTEKLTFFFKAPSSHPLPAPPTPPPHQNAVEELERLERAIADVKAGLLRRLHGALRAETFGSTPPLASLETPGGDTTPSASSEGAGGNGAARRLV